MKFGLYSLSLLFCIKEVFKIILKFISCMCFSCACYVYVACMSGVHGGQRGQTGTEVSDCELLESEPECSLQPPEVI